jgi:hypothetical protein
MLRKHVIMENDAASSCNGDKSNCFSVKKNILVRYVQAVGIYSGKECSNVGNFDGKK